jgi:hypothetical protein
MNYKSNHIPGLVYVLLMLIIFLVVFFGQIAIEYSPHAEARHGEDAIAVRRCMDERGPVAHLINLSNGRHYFVCQLDEKTFGVQIMVKSGMKWREISAYTKNKLHTLDQVIRYLNNGGAH